MVDEQLSGWQRNDAYAGNCREARRLEPKSFEGFGGKRTSLFTILCIYTPMTTYRHFDGIKCSSLR